MATHDGPMEWPDMDHISSAPVFNTKAAVQQTGIPAPTLRAWERRYAVLSPERADNAYRLYSERDIALIRWLKERIDDGMSISQAIALYRHLNASRPKQPEPLTSSKSSATNDTEEPAIFQPTLPSSAVEPLRDWDQPLPATDYLPDVYSNTQNMHAVRNHLIEIFQNLDEQTAHVMMGSLFSMYPLEQVCLDIITPTLWRIGQLWAEGKITVSVEHFASNFFRALLTNRFYVTPSPLYGPLVIVACAPREGHELASLMLALFLRRSGLRVAYLGQSIEITGLLHSIRTLHPALVCISSTMPQYLPDLLNLGRQVQTLPEPRPTMVFGGQIFAKHAKMIAELPGVYMDGDLKDAAANLHRIIQEQAASKI